MFAAKQDDAVKDIGRDPVNAARVELHLEIIMPDAALALLKGGKAVRVDPGLFQAVGDDSHIFDIQFPPPKGRIDGFEIGAEPATGGLHRP